MPEKIKGVDPLKPPSPDHPSAGEWEVAIRNANGRENLFYHVTMLYKTHTVRRSHLDMIGIRRVCRSNTLTLSVCYDRRGGHPDPCAVRRFLDMLQTFTDGPAFETMTIAEKNGIVDALHLCGTYVTALGGPPNAPTRPILQIVSAGYKKFSDITDQELLAEFLHPKAKLSAVELRIILRRVCALYYNRWLADDDNVFCVAFVKVADM
jgi:hypothetical protein